MSQLSTRRASEGKDYPGETAGFARLFLAWPTVGTCLSARSISHQAQCVVELEQSLSKDIRRTQSKAVVGSQRSMSGRSAPSPRTTVPARGDSS